VDSVFDQMKTQSKKEEVFHQSRRMFCIKNNVIHLGPINSHWSHVEWFKHKGWLGNNTSQFLNSNIRGFYSFSDNTLYSYIGVGFGFNDDVIQAIKSCLPELYSFLKLTPDTIIAFGPKDKVINNQEWPQLTIGKIRDYFKEGTS